MVDYSRFDKIDDLEEPDDADEAKSNGISSSSPQGPTTTQMTPKGKDGRLKFEYEGRKIYEWEQSLDEVVYWHILKSLYSNHDLGQYLH